MEASDILNLAMRVARDRFVLQFPEPLLVGDNAVEQSFWQQQEQTAVGRLTPGSLRGQLICPLRRPRRPGDQHVSVGRLPDCDVVIVDETVSKSHAWFARGAGEGWVLGDAGSRNGTWVEEHRLDSHQVVPVRLGMRIRFGHVVLTLVDSGAFWDRLHPGDDQGAGAGALK